jgi:hypothetical protein
LVCPSCQLTNIEKGTKICPRCGDFLSAQTALSNAEIDLIKEKSILHGKIAELNSREKKYRSRISTLRTYVILLLFLLPISHFVCNRALKPTYNDFTSYTEVQFAHEQLQFHRFVLRELLEEAPTFLYITQYGDTPEDISKAFYNDRIYADTILKDNQVYNDRRMPTNDTIILRKNPRQIISNLFEIRALQKHELIKGSKKVLRDMPEFE